MTNMFTKKNSLPEIAFRFDEEKFRVKRDYPKNINSHWQGISRVNGAFQDNNRKLYISFTIGFINKRSLFVTQILIII